MRKHREKVVLGSVGRFDRGLLFLDHGFGPPAFRHGRGERHRGDEQQRGGTLHDEKRLIFRFHDKWTEVVQRAPNGESRENEDAGGSFALGETESGPDHDRSADERDRIVFGGDRKPTTKNNLAQSKQQESKEDDLKSFRAVPAPVRCDKPKNDQGCEHEPAGDIAEPPGDPDCPVIRPVSKTAKGETGDAKSRGDHRARHDGEREFENVLGAIESASAAGKSIDEPGAANRFECVSRCDPERRGEVSRSREIDEKCAEKNGRPRAVTEQEQSRERNSRGRPHRRRTVIQEGELQSELARDEINDRDNADDRQSGKTSRMHRPRVRVALSLRRS